MRTFTKKEYAYLEKLRRRNARLTAEGPLERLKDSLTKPMPVEERKLRSMIRKRCRRYLIELALAEYCGLIPDRVMISAGMNTVYDGLKRAFDLLVQKGLEEEIEKEDRSQTLQANNSYL